MKMSVSSNSAYSLLSNAPGTVAASSPSEFNVGVAIQGKVIVITGGSDGIGMAAAKRLSGHGHEVVIVGRSPSKTEAAAREIGVNCYAADFTKLSEVGTLARRLLERYPRIDVLANNAARLFSPQRRVTPNGHEINFQVNYLAGFLLTKLLLDRLIESRATVVFAASVDDWAMGHIDIKDLENEKKYNATKAYADSQLAQILFTRELHRRYWRRGLSAAAFHPGHVASRFASERGSLLRSLYQKPIRWLRTVSPEQGADTLVFLAKGMPGVDFPSGEYFYKRKAATPNEQADDQILARKLWNRSQAMVSGLDFLRAEWRHAH